MFGKSMASMKKLSVTLAVSALFAAGTAQADTLDLTTWASTGPVSLSTNLANLTAPSSISQSVTNVTSFQWFFQANDYMPYNDWGYVSLNGVATTLSSVAAVGDYGNSGWHTYNFGSTFSGNLGFGVNNAIDNSYSSQLYVQNVVAVPEPETYAMVLAGLGLLGFVARRKQYLAV